MAQTIQRTRIPIVRLDGLTALTDGDWMKFIQIQDRETDKMYLRADPQSDYHRDILCKFRDEAHSTLRIQHQEGRFFCPGGGRIRRDHARQEIKIYDYSVDFGKYDIKTVKAIATPYLRRKLPGWKATFE
ncbi:TPA: hypothetical protein HA251_02910 [Candidatus Woesearchaeota archaeon]|nr:hypothetical protein [Candidatus Woesearchaeota archaeon]